MMDEEKERAITKMKRIKRRMKKSGDDQGRIKKIHQAIKRLREE